MSKFAEVTYCPNERPCILDIRADAHEGLFLALGAWLRDNPNFTVDAINIYWNEDEDANGLFVVVNSIDADKTDLTVKTRYLQNDDAPRLSAVNFIRLPD
jgi:hypothetical protein